MEAPVWREVTREHLTAKPSRERPLILVPIHRLSRAAVKPVPIGVLRVTDKTQGFFTDDDLRVLEGIVSIISLCHEYQRNQSHFIEAAVYQLMQPMQAIHARARRISREVPPKRAEDYRQLQALLQCLHDVFQTMAFRHLGSDYARAVKPVDLNQLIEDHLQNYLVYAQVRHRKPIPKAADIFARGARPVRIVTNEALLCVVLFHLFDNAFKWSRTAQGFRVELQSRQSGPIVIIRDDGLGISESDVRCLSEPFFKAERQPARVDPGQGMGLFVSRQAVIGELRGNLVITTKARNGDFQLVRDFAADETRKEPYTGAITDSFTVAQLVLPPRVPVGSGDFKQRKEH